jgi:flagellar hook-associated protein 2
MSSISSALSSLLGSSSSSSNGIDISSILESLTGASSSGLDVTTAVESAVSAAQAPEAAWSTQLSSLESQASALQQIQTDVQNLDNDVQQLNSITGPLASNTVTSSNSSIVSASAASGTALGTHVVTVNNLATTATWTSGEFASSSTDLPAGSFTITTGSGPTTITTDGTETLSDVANQINGDNLGVTASVITDANGSRLAIVANTSGAAANFTVSGSAGFGFTQPVTGTNASLTVDGVAISSATNTVSGALSGVTLNLLGASAGTQVTLNIQPDTSSASSAINQFVTDYNTVITDINNQFSDTSSGQGPLAQDSNIINLQNAVEQSLDFNSSGNSVNLSSLGISINQDGTLSVDSSTLQNTLQNNYAGVQSFFQGSALNGFANNMDQQLTDFLAPGNGAFTVDLQSMNSQESTLKTDITNFQTNVIDPLQTRLTAQFSQAETELQELPMELKQINQEFNPNSNSGS